MSKRDEITQGPSHSLQEKECVSAPPQRCCGDVLGPPKLFDLIQDSLLIQMIKNKVLERKFKTVLKKALSTTEVKFESPMTETTSSHKGTSVDDGKAVDATDIMCNVEASNSDHINNNVPQVSFVGADLVESDWVYIPDEMKFAISKPDDEQANILHADVISDEHGHSEACTKDQETNESILTSYKSDTSSDSVWCDSDDDTSISGMSDDILPVLQGGMDHEREMDYTESVTDLYNMFTAKMEHIIGVIENGLTDYDILQNKYKTYSCKSDHVKYIPPLAYLCSVRLNQMSDISMQDGDSSSGELFANTDVDNAKEVAKIVTDIDRPTSPTLYQMCTNILKRIASSGHPNYADIQKHSVDSDNRDQSHSDVSEVPTLYHLCSSHTKQLQDARQSRKRFTKTEKNILYTDSTKDDVIINERVPTLLDLVIDKVKGIIDSSHDINVCHETAHVYTGMQSLRSFSQAHVLKFFKCVRVFFRMERILYVLSGDDTEDSEVLNQIAMLKQFVAKSYLQNKKNPYFELALKVADVKVNINDKSLFAFNELGLYDPNSNNNAVDSLRELAQRSIDISTSETSSANDTISYNDNCGTDREEEAEQEKPTQSLNTSISVPCHLSTKNQSLNARSVKGSRSAKSAKSPKSSKSPAAVDRIKKKYVLVPMVHIPDEKGKQTYGHSWTDVATVINQGTFNHRNVNIVAGMRHELLKTISTIYLPSEIIKKRLFAVKPLKPSVLSLHQILPANAETRLFKENHVKFVCACLMMALRFLHESDIYHGTIGPKKVVFNERGYPLLVGFSSAQEIGGRQSRYREVCPFEYSSPEILYRWTISETTDVWAVGAIIYTMLFGKPPHVAPTKLETRRNILDAKFIPSFAPDEISSRGRKFLLHCLRNDDEKRFTLLHGKGWDFEYIPWFNLSDSKEEALYKQAMPSPVAKVLKKFKEATGSPKPTADTSPGIHEPGRQ